MPDAHSLYERDFFLWTVEQSRLLRDVAKIRTNLPLEWDHLAEEIESLGLSERRELGSRIARIIEHLLKLEFSPASDPRRGWEETVSREREDVRRLLKNSPSLKRVVEIVVAEECRGAARITAQSLAAHGEIDAEMAQRVRDRILTEQEVFGETPV